MLRLALLWLSKSLHFSTQFLRCRLCSECSTYLLYRKTMFKSSKSFVHLSSLIIKAILKLTQLCNQGTLVCSLCSLVFVCLTLEHQWKKNHDQLLQKLSVDDKVFSNH